jgi:uncharacterized protein involved in exopolysaccharide biosynthesis
MSTAPKKTDTLADREAALSARLAEIEQREKAVAEREAALPKAKFTIRDLHRAVLSDPTISDTALTEMAIKAGAEFKPVTVKTQRALALGFIKLVKEAGHWQDAA